MDGPHATVQPNTVSGSGQGGPRGPAGLILIGIAGPLFYVVMTTVLGVLWDGYDQIRDTQSELGAVDSPYRHLMNFAGFSALGVSIVAFATAYALAFRRGIWHTLATLLLVVAGAGMVIVGFLPCDPGCVDVTQTGRLHGTFSAPAAIGLPMAAMLSATVFRADGRFSTTWQAASFWLGLLALASGPVIAAELLDDANGLLQRAAMWPPLLWMTAVSMKLRSLASAPWEPATQDA